VEGSAPIRRLLFEPLEPRILLSGLEFRMATDSDTGASHSDAITRDRYPAFEAVSD